MHLFVMDALYLLFLPLLFSDRPRCYRRLHRCQVRLLRRRPHPYRRATRQAEPFSSLDIAYLFRTFLALCIVTATAMITILFNCIACFCRPLMQLPLSYVAYYIYYI